jgi:hypothetical protein
MRFRVSAVAFLLSSTLPVVLTEGGIASPLAEPVAHAQAASDTVTEVARQRFADGVKAFDAGRYEDARSAFLQAYALKRNALLLLNLAQSELKSGHAEDAGNHFHQFLREVPNAKPEEKASAEKGIADAKKKAGFIVVIVDASGADVSIDGALVGKSPLLDPVFVKPGSHTVLATAQGHSATVTVDAKPGSATAANLATGATSVAAAPAPVPAPVPAPGPAVAPPMAPAAAPPPEPVAAMPPPSAPPPTMGASFGGNFGGPGYAGATPDQAAGRESFFHWYTHKPLAWVGTGATVAGLVLGISFSAAAGSASSTADSDSSTIKAHAMADPSVPKDSSGNVHPCGSQDSSGSDLPGYEKACNALRDDLSAHSTDVALATTGWVLFGVGAIGTAAYAIVDWYMPQHKKTTGALSPRVEGVAPLVSPTARGIAITGSF